MDRHEQIKQQCVQIMNYYYILPDTEFQLNTKERVDVVGYYKNRKVPDIGIEVELSSGLQHDAAKLTKTTSFQWRLVVTEHPDTLLLGPTTHINGTTIEIVLPPDKDTAFETKIRELTGQNKKTWFNEFREQIDKETHASDKNPLPDFVEEIRDQGLDVVSAKDIVFRAALGGIHFGYYSQDSLGTTYRGPADIPREMLYLRARGLIFEDRPGRSYDTGRQSVYYLSRDGYDIAGRIIEERINDKENKLRQIVEKYGNNAVIISLLGEMGRFVDRTDLSEFLANFPYSQVQLPSTSVTWNEIPRDLIEEFNFDPEIVYTARIVASSPMFRQTLKEIYRAFTDSRLGSETRAFSSKGDSLGEMYSVPMRALLRRLEIEDWLDALESDKLREYALLVILRAHNPSVPNTLSDPISAIGLDMKKVEGIITELFSAGITSKPVKSGVSTFVIYDAGKFNEFCEKKLNALLQNILEGE